EAIFLRPAVEVAIVALLLHAPQRGISAGAATSGGAARATARNVLDQAVEEAGIVFRQGLPLLGRRTRHRGLNRQRLNRLAFQRAGHDAIPKAGRQGAAGYLLHPATIVI